MAGETQHPGTIDRLYALNAGFAVQPDRSVYTPGKWKGEQITLSCNAYLIHRSGEWTMFDTGIEDAIANEAGGWVIAHNIRGIVIRTIRDQFADIGIAPEPTIVVRESDAAAQLAPQDNQLMSENRILGLKPGSST